MTSSAARAKRRTTKRLAAGFVALALAIATPAALASSAAVRPAAVHAHVERSGTVVVSGYDGGAPLAPAR